MAPQAPSETRKAAPSINLASVVHGLDAYVREHGRDPTEALLRAGLDVEDLSDPEGRVPLVRYLELLEICAELMDDPQFGLKFGAQYDPRHAGVVGNVALASRTLGDALEIFARYLPTMVDAAVFGIDVSDGVAFAYSYYVDPLLMSYHQKTDWTIGFFCNLIRVGLNDASWRPLEALFPHVPPESPKAHRTRVALIGSEIRIGHPWAGIRFDAANLNQEMATADAMVERLMRHYGDLRLSRAPERQGDLERLRREIARLLVKGQASVGELAKSAGMSPRTLQRRLNDEGITYAGLLEDVRRTLALNLLENETLALGQIAFSLGYSDASAFSHAFRRWTNRSPGDYRRSGL
jgi:AraC-like DNA-binding protein